MAAACGDDGDDNGQATDSTSREKATTAAVDAPPADTWENVAPGGDCACSDGSEFSFWVRGGDPDKVLLFFEGGGACWDMESCDPDSAVSYKPAIDPDDDDPSDKGGIWDIDNPGNPFADYSAVYVPYCTGDVHVGDSVTEYSDELTIHHRGAVNGTAALDRMVATFPDADKVVVAGESAGSIASPFYAGLVSEHYPDADITVLADGSGAYPDTPEWQMPVAQNWGVERSIPDWEGFELEEWSIPALFVQAGLHDPDITFARHDFANDAAQDMFLTLSENPVPDILAEIDANEARIESDTALELHSYTEPGEEHTTLSDDTFYSREVEGVALVDWVAALVAGEPMDDVRCADCMGVGAEPGRDRGVPGDGGGG